MEGMISARIPAIANNARLSEHLSCRQASVAAAELLVFPLRGRKDRQILLKPVTRPETNKLTLKILVFLKSMHTM